MQDNTDIQLLSQVQRTLSVNPDASQRELASSTNLSLGMTNALLKRFSDKGWLYMKKISTRNIQYVLTPTGLNELMHRSSRYFKRTARLMKDYKDIITELVKTCNCKNILIIGNTDLEFLFDFACELSNVQLHKTEKAPTSISEDTLVIFSDTSDYLESQKFTTHNKNIMCISNILQSTMIEAEELTWQIL